MRRLFWLQAAFVLLFSCHTTPKTEGGLDASFPEAPLYSLELVAAGDNLIHATMIAAAKDGEAYNFDSVYSEIKPLIQNADLAFINQETVMGGEDFGYSGYPRFNTPSSMAKTLVETGFDIVNLANNHTMDMGEAGLVASMDTWSFFPGITLLGARRTAEKPPLVITKNNISLGFLSYTYGTNGIPLPKDKPWMVSLIDRETMAAEIDALRPLCDFLIVSAHWGAEYAAEPGEAQIDLARFFAEHRVDLVIGHHPHVLQRVEYLPRADGKQTVCFYSLGNFASNQQRKATVLGGLLYVKFLKRENVCSIDEAGIIPVVTHYEEGFTKTRVIPLYAYSKELLETHRLFSRDKDFTADYFHGVLAKLGAKLYPQNYFEDHPAYERP